MRSKPVKPIKNSIESLSLKETVKQMRALRGSARLLTPLEKKKMEKKLSTEKGRQKLLRQLGFDD